MKAFLPRCGAILLAAAAAGCATPQGAGVLAGADVTRFHLDQPVARAQIAVEPLNQADGNHPEFAAYAASVARELSRHGWTVVPGTTRSEQVALISVEQGSREAIGRRSAVSVGIGGGTGGWGRSGVGVGVGVGVGIPVGGARSHEIVATMLEVRIQRRSDATVFWEGRASTEARVGTPLAERPAAVDMLADAVFRDFPGESGRTIRVR